MSFSTRKVSPLDQLRGKAGQVIDHQEKKSEVLVLRERGNSTASFDSVQTTERLLDRLDLNEEDEALLQQALKEAQAHNLDGFTIKKHENRAVCVPASGFPSLRKSSGSSVQSEGSEYKPLMNILKELSEKEKITLSKKKQVELHLPRSRYSYFVEEESDGDQNGDFDFQNRTINFENYRTRNGTRLPATKSVSHTSESDPVSENTSTPYRLPSKDSAMNSGAHPLANIPGSGSSSSLETKGLIKRSTQSSIDSEISRESDKRSKQVDEAPKWKFSTPMKTGSASASRQTSVSPSKRSSEHHKGHKKTPSSFFKNFFKSPKVSESRPEMIKVKSTGSTPMSTPPSNKFQFPVPQLETASSPGSRAAHPPLTASSDLTPQFPPRTHLHFDHNRASSDPNVLVSRRSEMEGYKRGEPHEEHATHFGLVRPKTHEAAIRPSQKELHLNTDARIRMVIELRNRGNLKASTEHLKALCEMQNPTGFLLYGLALRYGSGVDKDYPQSLHYLKKAADIRSEEDEIFVLDIDPFKLAHVPHVPPEPRAPALYECGMAYLKGYGVAEVDEIKGIKYLEKAASLGHLDSMCLSGTLWSKSSEKKTKNKARAAAWFRLADRRGADLIGADWIYKDKYQSRSIDSL
ncbi:LAFA_0E14752g1_1 [Lachancea sp. 'fantastica']|nr:LAFA_0E14752g1_1 [Lachancea sp. 'fantastica']